MPLPSPILDDRSFQQLKDELVRRIPVYTPEWTDHNESDPGITILELFAHLGETLLYRFNQIPETTKLAFLRLLKIPLRPAAPSRAMVALTPKNGKGLLVELGAEGQAGKIGFELDTEVYALPVKAFAIAKQITPLDQDADLLAAMQRIVTARGAIRTNEVAAPYRAVALDIEPKPDADGVDFAATVDDMLWIPVLRDADKPDAEIVKELAGHVLNIGVVPFEPAPPMANIDACPGTGVSPPPPVIVWQISVGLDDKKTPRFRELVPCGDTTRGLSDAGVVRLRLPQDVHAFAPLRATDLDDADREGSDDLPPPIEDEEQAKKVLCWLRAFRQDGGSLRRLLWVGANASVAVQLRTALPEFLGMGTAQPNQQGQLVNRSVVADSVQVEVEETGGWTRWTEVVDFEASGRDDRHFVLNSDAGLVTFGNGIRGRAPQIGERLRARHYRYGGGLSGNVPAGAINKLPKISGVTIANVLPARGGDDPESIEAALDRIPSEFRRHDRAVAESDFRELAMMTPGAEIGRAEVLPLFHPQRVNDTTPGVVSVVVWPREDPRHPGAPWPDRTLLSSVCRWLDTRRLVTTELYVIPPTYRKIAVSVGIEVKPGHGVEAVRRWVELVIRQYLAPLPPYGPSGNGWPLGRRVHGPELESAALQVEGVEFLYGLNLASIDDNVPTQRTTVILTPWEVPQLTDITIVSGKNPDPATVTIAPAPHRPKGLDGRPLPLPPPGSGSEDPIAVPVPIPVPKEEC